MKRLEDKSLSLTIWWGSTSGDGWDIKPGFTRKTEYNLHSLRIGQLCIVFGVDDFG